MKSEKNILFGIAIILASLAIGFDNFFVFIGAIMGLIFAIIGYLKKN